MPDRRRRRVLIGSYARGARPLASQRAAGNHQSPQGSQAPFAGVSRAARSHRGRAACNAREVARQRQAFAVDSAAAYLPSAAIKTPCR